MTASLRSRAAAGCYAGVFGAALPLLALCCPVTAYELPVDLRVLCLVCLGAAGLWALLFALPYRKVTLPLALAAGGCALWRLWDPIRTGFCLCVQEVTDLWALVYPGFPAQHWMELPAGTEATLCFGALAVVLTGLVVWPLSRRWGSAWRALSVCAPWAAVCLVVVDVTPALWALVGLLGAGVLLALTRRTRADDPQAGLRLSLLLTLPVAALLLGLLWWQSPANYQRADWPDRLEAALSERLGCLSGLVYENGTLQPDAARATGAARYWSAEQPPVDLSDLGPRRSTGATALRVRAEVDGPLYLRGAALSGFDDGCWTAQALTAGHDPLALGGDGDLRVDIRLAGVHGVLYTPYFPAAAPGPLLDDRAYANPDGLTDYSVAYHPVATAQPDAAYAARVYGSCLDVPEQTRAELLALAQETQLNQLDADTLPDAVADWVRQRASYNLSAARTPVGEDFTLWFLNESREGYCVHFATAAALMLRSLGVPARYVTGYLVEARAGRWVTATDADAHAWVEYYVDGVGWLPLEATPGMATELPDESAPAEPDEPEPAEPDVPDEPATPDEPEPAEPDVPDTPTESDEPAAPDAAPAARRPLPWGWILGSSAGALLLAAALLSRPLRLRARRRALARGDANAQALAYWRQILRLARHAGEHPPAELAALARKARFSQHRLDEAELARFRQTHRALTEALRRRRGLRLRLKIRWLWADC